MIRDILARILCEFGKGIQKATSRSQLRSLKYSGLRTRLRSPVVIYHAESISVGSFVDIGENVVLRGAGGIAIGDRVLIAAGAVITTVGHPLKLPRWGITVTKPVKIGDDVWIGANAVILPGVSIGSGSIVGAGAVVSRDVPADTVVAGVPARVIKTIPRATNPS